MNAAEHYTYRVHWSAEDEEYVATVAELPSLSYLAADRVQALQGIHALASDVVADLTAAGEPVPQAIADREYSGKFVVRVPSETHRRLAIEAAEQGISMNLLATTRLAAH